MANTLIQFTYEETQFIKQQLETGLFSSENEVIHKALTVWRKYEQDLANKRAIFQEIHRRNAHLNASAIEALVDEEVKTYRQSRHH